jgi:hypothetical protein
VRKAVAQGNNGFHSVSAQQDAKHPLPPEGQRVDEEPGKKLESDRYERKLREKDGKYYQPGWYVWYSKSRWAVQEKIELMTYDLAVHSNWYKHAAKLWDDWDRQRGAKQDMSSSEPPSLTLTAPSPPASDPS